MDDKNSSTPDATEAAAPSARARHAGDGGAVAGGAKRFSAKRKLAVVHWVYREMDYAVFAFTIHPDVAGRPQVLLMLERLNGHEGIEWATFDAIANDFRKRYPFESGKRPEVI